MMTSVISIDKSTFFKLENKSRILCDFGRGWYLLGFIFMLNGLQIVKKLKIFDTEGRRSFCRFSNMILFHKQKLQAINRI